MHGSYTIQVRFDDAPGVTKDTPVRKSGILIGRVTDVELIDQGGVLVTAKIDGDRKLFRSDVPRINPTLLGDTAIQFFPMPERHAQAKRGDEPVKPGETLQGYTGVDPLELVTEMQANVAQVISSVTRTSDEMGRLATRFNDLLDHNDGKLERMITEADATMKSISTTMANYNDLVADPATRRDLIDAAKQLPVLFHDARDMLGKLNGSFDLITTNLQSCQKFTGPLGDAVRR